MLPNIVGAAIAFVHFVRGLFHGGFQRTNYLSVNFVVFDLLWLNGRDLRILPQIERKPRLRAIVPTRPSALLYCDHVETRGVELFERVCAMDMEGIVAKRKDGLYTPEETSWVKIRNPGYSQAEGPARTV